MTGISLVMIVKNEARCIKRCLDSVKTIVDEIVVVDTGSTDNTKKIALSCGAKVFDYTWQNDFAKARNYALEQASGDWNLVLDADEYITNVDKGALLQFLKNKKQLGSIKIINEIHTKDDKNYSKVYVARLLPREIRYVRSIHEQPNSNLPNNKVAIEVYHDGYINQEVKINRNLGYLKEQVKRSPNDAYMRYQLAYTLYLNKEYKVADENFKKFYHLVNTNSSYRNAGIISWIENGTKLGNFDEIQKIIEKEEVNLQKLSEFYFVCAAFYIEYVLSDVKKNIQYLPLVEECYLECLNIGENEEQDGAVGTGTYLAAYNLGTWYEALKQYDKAMIYYEMAKKWKYEKANNRIEIISKISK